MNRKDVLNFETRRRIYNYILKHPGIHLRGISRGLDLKIHNLEYHLKFLIKQDFIYIKENDSYHRFFVAKKIGNKEEKLLCFLREKTIRDMIVLLKWRYAVSLKDISNALEKQNSTISYHLEKLKEADIIEVAPTGDGFVYRPNGKILERNTYGRVIYYRLKEPNFIRDTLLMHEKSILNGYAKGILFTKKIISSEEERIRELDHIFNNLIEQFNDMFPNPYCA